MRNPLLIAFRAGATIVAGVFLVNWLFAPAELTLEQAREWEVDSHMFIERAGRVSLLLQSSAGRRVKVGCEHYLALCTHVKESGEKELRLWTDELGYFSSTSLLQARVGERDVVSFRSQQLAYEGRTWQRNAPLIVFLALAVVAWRWPRIARRLRPEQAA